MHVLDEEGTPIVGATARCTSDEYGKESKVASTSSSTDGTGSSV